MSEPAGDEDLRGLVTLAGGAAVGCFAAMAVGGAAAAMGWLPPLACGLLTGVAVAGVPSLLLMRWAGSGRHVVHASMVALMARFAGIAVAVGVAAAAFVAVGRPVDADALRPYAVGLCLAALAVLAVETPRLLARLATHRPATTPAADRPADDTPDADARPDEGEAHG